MSMESELLALFHALHPRERRSLLDYAAFLAQRSCRAVVPKTLPRPESETVVHAIRRLNRAHPQLRRHPQLTRRAEALLAQHMVDARPAGDVIDELERCYRESLSPTDRDE